MPAITELPCEVIAAILRRLDDVRSLGPAQLACRHFYTSFRQHPGIPAAVLRRQLTPALLPYAVALQQAGPHDGAGDDDDDTRPRLLDVLAGDPARLAARVRAMPLDSLGQMARMHELIRGLATGFAAEAWARLRSLPGSDAGGEGELVLSPAESFRFCRAFYRLELFYRLARRPWQGGGDGSTAAQGAESWFFSQQPVWENEQIGAAHELLEAKFCQACRDTIAHDVGFGEIRIDYLRVGKENDWNQLWLSQGLDYCHRVMSADSYAAKKALLSTVFGQPSANLPQALEAVAEAVDDGDRLVDDCSEAELRSSVSHRDDSDPDKGPYEAWRAAHAGLPIGLGLMLDDNAWLRERAYVFWDWDRIQSIDLLGVIESGPPEGVNSPNDITEQDLSAMEESFTERSNVWQSGGSGYWSGGADVSNP